MSPVELSPIAIGLIGLAIFFILLAIGLPVGFGLALVGFVGFVYLASVEAGFSKIAMTPFATVSSYNLSVIPLFVFMANICFRAGFGRDLYNLAFNWLGPLPGGLAMTTVAACALFASISSSAIATAMTLGLVALPEMKKYKYKDSLATGCIAAGGTMGVLIPPSSGLIIYAIIAQQSIGRLFIAGVIPGILEAAFYIIAISIVCKIEPAAGPPGPKTTFKEKLAPILKCGDVAVLVLLVLGGIFFGFFTPTEGGAVGAFGALVISLVRRRLSWQDFKGACLETLTTTGMIYILMIGAFLFNYFMAVSTIPMELANFAAGLPWHPLGIMVIIMLIYILLGCFLEPMSMTLLTIPIFLPVIVGLGFDPIWFGIITVRMCEIGAITPPIGLGVFVIAGVAKDVPMERIFRGIIPFLIADICEMILLLFVPQLALFLPNLMYANK